MKSFLIFFLSLFLSAKLFAVLPITGPAGVCVGSHITLSDATPGGTWSSSNADAFIDPTGLVTGVSGGVDTITYTVGGSYVTLAITVNPLPAPISGDSVYCLGSTGVMTDITPGGVWSGDPAYVTIGSSTGLVTGISPGITLITYTLPTGCSVLKLVTVTPSPAPSLSSSLTPPSICDSVIFNYTPLSATPGALFAWSRAYIAGIVSGASTGTGNPDEQLINTTAYRIAVSYVYTLTAAGCSNMQTVVVTVNPTPMLLGTLTPPAQCDTLIFLYTPTSLTPGTTYTWARPSVAGIGPAVSSGTGSISEALLDSTTSPINVTYYIRLTGDGCVNSFSQAVTVSIIPCSVLLGTENIQTTNALNIYPNPTTGTIVLHGLEGVTSLEVFNVLGQKIFSRKEIINAEETIDLMGQPSGVYFIVTSDDKGIVNNKIIKQ